MCKDVQSDHTGDDGAVKRYNDYTRIYDRFHGYYLEDCDCRYCLYYLGSYRKKARCALNKCLYLQEILDAIDHKRVFRKREKQAIVILKEYWERNTPNDRN